MITSLSVDANGTRHVALHSEPDMITLWRYLGTSLLLLAVVISTGYNAAAGATSSHQSAPRRRYPALLRQLLQSAAQSDVDAADGLNLTPGPPPCHLLMLR